AVATHLRVHLGDQRAGRVDDRQAAPRRRGPDGRGDTVGGQHEGLPLGHLVGLLAEDRATGLQVADDVCVVDDLPAHVDRTAGPAAAATAADSTSTASAPVAASLPRSAPCTAPGRVTSGPTCTVRPCRRSAEASRGAAGPAIGTSSGPGPRSSAATTTSPGR